MKPALWMVFCALVPVFATAQDCIQKIPVNVLDQKRTAITALGPEVFQARMRETIIPVRGLEQVSHRRILVLVDESGSMDRANTVGTFELQAVQNMEETLTQLLSQLPAGSSAAYGLFSKKSLFTDGFISDPKELGKAIADVKEKFKNPGTGSTALFDSLYQAALKFAPAEPGDTIVLMTDGGENSSKLIARDFERRFLSLGLRLVVLMVGGRPPNAPEEIEGPEKFLHLAQETGGSRIFIHVNDPAWGDANKVAASRALLQRFWSQEVLAGYVMHLQVPAGDKKPRKWTLQVKSADNLKFDHAILQYPDILMPCPVNTAAVH